MRRFISTFAALAIGALAFAGSAAADESHGPNSMERMQNWAEDHEAFLDAKLAGLKAGLRLTPDQEKLWPPFETAIRDAAKLHMDQMKSMIERTHKMHEQSMEDSDDADSSGDAVSPVDRLMAMGQHMSAHGAAIEKVADAAKPLYASLDDSQKRRFAMLGRALFMMGHGHHGSPMMMHGGMGMMGRHDMGAMAPSQGKEDAHDDDEEDSDKD